MKIEKEVLVKALSNVKKAIEKSTMESFEAFNIKSSDGIMSITGGSAYMTITGSFPTESDEKFSCVINADALFSTISKIMVDYIELTLNNDVLQIRSDDVALDLPTMDPGIFPVEDVTTDGITMINAPDSLQDYVKACEHSVGNEKRDFRMASFFVEFGDNNEVKVTTLDGQRISKRYTSNFKPNKSFIASGKTFKTALRIIEDNLMLGLMDTKAIISGKSEGCTYNISINLVEGDFYSVDSIIKNLSGKIVVKASKQDLLSILNLSVLFKRLVLTICENNINVNAKGDEGCLSQGKLAQRMAVVTEGITGDEKFRIGINSKYLSDAVNSLEDDFITIKFSGDVSPIMLSSNEKELEIILPIKLQ